MGVQSIALSSSSSSCCRCRERNSASSRVCADGAKIAGRSGSEACPKMGPDVCQVRCGIGSGALERERLSRSSGDSMVRVCEKDGAVVEVELSSGGLDVREAESAALGVLPREEEVSIRRTAGGRWRRRVRME